MKKTLMVLMMVLIVAMLIVSCDNKAEEPEGFHVGGKGPAGGIIFYDCDADNNDENEGAGPDGLKSSVCGWRYLEAATEDVGSYKWRADGATTSYGTKDGIGEGHNNTHTVLKNVGITGFPAAEACVNYKGGGYTDWFLPSREEIAEMHKYKVEIGVVESTDAEKVCYWSSSEFGTAAWGEEFANSARDYSGKRTESLLVRPVRYFK